MDYQISTTELHAAAFAARTIEAVTEFGFETGFESGFESDFDMDFDLADHTVDAIEALWASDHCPREIAIRDERLAGLLM